MHRLPRIEIGSVVLRRGSWTVAPGAAPVRRAGEPEAGFFLRVQGWRGEHGLPERCFLRVIEPPAPAGGLLHLKNRKPVYLDFTSRHLLRVFEQMTAHGHPLVLTELLPELSDAPMVGPDETVGTSGPGGTSRAGGTSGAGERRVAEFIVEVAAARD